MTHQLLEKLNSAISKCESFKKVEEPIILTYPELLLLRRHMMTENYSIKLASANLRKCRN